MQGEGPSALSALGRQVNDSMPAYAVQRVEALIGPVAGKRVLILGLTFRPDVAVTPHTNAVDLLREFKARGAIVQGHDALLSETGVRELGFDPAEEPLRGYDVAVLHAKHRSYVDLDWAAIAPLLVDARNALDRTTVESRGVRYVGIGRPATPALE
jgi:UDP-N-acetyl-D-mannosaminuronate dehydrogenase